MECEDKSMERQKLVDGPDEEEDLTLPTSIGTTVLSKTPISPQNVCEYSVSMSDTPRLNFFLGSRSIQALEVIHSSRNRWGKSAAKLNLVM